ncbi:hypothetical protein [Paenibacillus vietnamensis]|nr:hypothetical protein [Paenibacillus vietnamensis]
MKSCSVNRNGTIQKPKFFGCMICYVGGWIWFGVQKLKSLRS